MPKMRSHKGSKKRFMITGTGAIRRGQAGTRHLAPGKTQKQTRHLRKPSLVTTADRKRIKQHLANL
ncbi:MAG: 50S ribosomal protein L35 [Bacilli bacterium]|jgi:large subunit ribosomal protein L35|nr:MAG: 50S ribosomal protein L35 [Tenericutes bacterium ADurb.Bin140]HON64534.1 50S ribosomal protein L35 [Bacilli bacterium]HPN90563.1 50S ribosomal protein L35 [Bacilli bacterium]HRS30431.1 50S ribosomal protein L35 [Bacilli bacterium]HRU49674.1 50S ribosomal protein L35 [Bacilli bacterium]